METIEFLFKPGFNNLLMGILSFLIVGGWALTKRRSFILWSLLALLVSFLGAWILVILLPSKSDLSSTQRGLAYMIGRFFFGG